MTRAHRLVSLLIACLLLSAVAGCSRDPNVKKKKYLESGKRYFEQEQYKEALIQFSNAIQVDPRYADAHYELARTYMKMGSPQPAFNELMRTIDIDPNHLKAQADLGSLLFAARQLDEAMKRAELVLSKDPNSLDGHMLKANVLAGRGDMDASLREMQTAVSLAPNDPKGHLNLGILLLSAKQPAAAEESMKKAIALDPKFTLAILSLGNFYLQEKRFPEAEQQIQAAVAADPKSVPARMELARFYLSQGQRARAEQTLADAKQASKDNPDALRLLGDFYVSMGEIDKAIAEFAGLVQQHPKELKLRTSYIALLLHKGRRDDAARLTDEILKENPKNIDGLIFKGQLLNADRKFKDASEILERALKAEPDNAPGHLHLGSAYAGVGDLGRAEKEWREAARLRPTLLEAWEALSVTALRKNDADLLMESAEHIIQSQPKSPAGYILRSAGEFSRKQGPAGEADLKKAMELAPDNPVPYARLAMWRIANRKYAEAEKLYEQSLEKNPNYTEGMQGLVNLYAAQNQRARALARVTAQIAKAPDNSAFYSIQGALLVANKELDKAEAALNKAIELSKNNLDAALLLAQVQVSRGRLDDAMVGYERMIAQNPRDTRAYVMLGALYETKQNWQKAEELYRKALTVEPDAPLAANNLAYLLLERGGNLDQAASLAQLAREKLPDSSGTADTLAWAYYHKGAYGLAIELLEEAIRKVPNNPNYHYHLGMAYNKSHDRDKTRLHFKKVLELDPNYSHAAEIKQVLDLLSKG